MDNLPSEIVLSIFQWLDYGSLLNARATCQLWKSIGEDFSLWFIDDIPPKFSCLTSSLTHFFTAAHQGIIGAQLTCVRLYFCMRMRRFSQREKTTSHDSIHSNQDTDILISGLKVNDWILKWMHDGMKRGDGLCVFFLGTLHADGVGGVRKDTELAEDLLRLAVSKRVPHSECTLVLLFINDHNYLKVRDYLFQKTSFIKPNSEFIEREGCYKLECPHLGDYLLETGVAFDSGKYVSQDFCMSAEFFRRGCVFNIPVAHYLFAYSYLKGRGVKQDSARCLQLLKRGGELKSIACLFVLFILYYGDYSSIEYNLFGWWLPWINVSIVQPNKRLALNYLRQAAEIGHIGIQFLFANILFLEGESEEALDWLSSAAIHGHLKAQINLAHLLRRRSPTYSLLWYFVALGRGATVDQSTLDGFTELEADKIKSTFELSKSVGRVQPLFYNHPSYNILNNSFWGISYDQIGA